jgi:hypothetical protein
MNHAGTQQNVAWKKKFHARKNATEKCLATLKLSVAEWFQKNTAKLFAHTKLSAMK